jgi:hypothetical protein
MPTTQVQFRRGNTAQNLAFTGALGEVTVDTTNSTLRVHDGVTPGGFETILANSTQTLLNKTFSNCTINSPTMTGNITGGANLIYGTSLISITGNITAGNISGTGNIDAPGNLTVGNLVITGAYTFSSLSATGNVSGNNFNASNIVSANTINVTNLANVGSLSTSGNVTLGNIVNAGSNGVGNIGTASTYFNTIFAKATSAQYADLAEIFVSDQNYEAGTVVRIGGAAEITQSISDHDVAVLGVVSDKPSYLMNSGIDGLAIALTGRVPCKVQGPVSRGSVLTTSNHPGTAQAVVDGRYRPGCVIGKALESIDDYTIKTIEIIVGRF